MDEITVTEGADKSPYITYLYNALSHSLLSMGGTGELAFSEGRIALRLRSDRSEELRAYLKEKIAEIIGIGYKSRFLEERLNVCLSKRERRLLSAALIAADLEGDKAYIRSRLDETEEYTVDGFYAFRLGALKEKWERILAYIPRSFASPDLKKFCAFLVEESRRKIYVKGNDVFAENFVPLRRSRLMGEEDVETEILLADAGYVFCLGEVEDSLGDFLQKYYAERAVFS